MKGKKLLFSYFFFRRMANNPVNCLEKKKIKSQKNKKTSCHYHLLNKNNLTQKQIGVL